MSSGPLSGYRFIEMAGVGPTQICGMLLGDMGAEVIRIERINRVELGVTLPPQFELWNRSRSSVAVDLKSSAGVELVLRLCEQVDGLYEGYRPGVMERLGLGPADCQAQNEKLVYGRMTGWGQQGPLANCAGHDPNYIAISGVLHAIGERDGPPVLPLNLVGDYAGGAMYLAMGLLAAMLEASKTGRGQVIDCAMIDGINSLMTEFHGMLAAGVWEEKRGSNYLDGGAHFFSVYRTRDDRHIVVAALEARFYRELLEKLGISDIDFDNQHDRGKWPHLKKKLQDIFSTRTQAQWCELFEGTDCCVSPVLTLDEAASHPHTRERAGFVEVDGISQPAPAPLFSRTPGAIQAGPVAAGRDTCATLRRFGFSERELGELQDNGVIHQIQAG